MAIELAHTQHHESVREQASELFHDLSTELKQEILEIRSGERPIKQQADLIVRRHVMGIIILLFGLVALILLIGIAAISLHGPIPH